MNGTNTGFAVPVCEKYIIVLRYKLSVNSRSSFWCFTFAVVSTLRCLTLAVALNNAPPAILYAKFSVILTRPVAFCRVLTLKIRLSSERSSFLCVVMSLLSSLRISIVVCDVVLLPKLLRRPNEHCLILLRRKVKKINIQVDVRPCCPLLVALCERKSKLAQ